MIDRVHFGTNVEQEADLMLGFFVEIQNFDEDIPGPMVEDVVHCMYLTEPKPNYIISGFIFWFENFECPKEHMFEQAVDFS